MTKDRCETYCFNEEKVTEVKSLIILEDIQRSAKLLKALADETRMKVVFALYQGGELCVCDVANIIEATVATTSHHLRLLRNMGIAKYRKEGKMAFYSLDDEHIEQLIQVLFAHQEELKTRS
ncbi:ArsR/SmtB family transcription factor [Metabacillus iocasae]|uniref:DNA-binding transcriptional ArsR family regulator n=1 Tax=Priestia iocasae TaxID=2291674 RepID=A0ABS2QPC4_9BACI|nr:metalloregulator ArsR/SmtB family transcription factor [Metabacillus iocasae]MBM7701306.1 DNA-binding transcriptional ArsR family regulator [Metabacillus iocasae]